ncbi:HAD-IA family hydrolase [Cyanobium gracile]|uniref:Haloacid dehalogenase superfamily protein, subfamily IA, variant 3 with third motif having DD or ED n=1 Tax=Cyanobium gracile (strain ATCC 27147 / PCC 6307) TaxID=292564 RepID=K9P5T3_CYAGP|nr:HAD-IA family hydrolase [Cyanobium gracile]AFY27904.1 haloacid dehalogenase superfamily protein, subfamily IA, variant 3 with third motif having DD or ED [Cyanobium gracile PCC 6307]
MAPALSALLWDVDGTLAETEFEGHRVAFNRSFEAAGLPWRWDRPTYGRLLAVGGGHERITAFLEQVEGRTPERGRVEELQRRKQAFYAALVREGGLALRPGVARLVEEAAAAGLRQAIVTTSGRSAVQALLEGAPSALGRAFAFWVCGDDVARKKPDPEAYRLALRQLGVMEGTKVGGVLVLEDSPAGLAAATGAGLPCLVCLSTATREEPASRFSAARAVIESLEVPGGMVSLRRGPPCPGSQVTLSWLERLLDTP